MIAEETFERIKELLFELEEYSEEGVPIVVEGARDEEALRELNVKGPIFQISSSKKTALNFLEDLARYRRVIVFTDFDEAGDELAKFCAKHLQRLGPEPVMHIREELKTLLRKDVKEVQELARFLRNQAGESGEA
ncbi:MAG: toprim domain-containing protein, partial [Hadesarchaea archaeon]|nr:toprim domain-containing protein [Hadesarchaea archaeon]